MQILDIAPAKINTDYIDTLLAIEHLHPEITTLPPSPLSFLTTMSIAGTLKNHPCEFVLVHRIKDLSAAVAARRLSRDRGHDFKIITSLTERYADRHIPPVLASEIDTLIYQEPHPTPHGLKSEPKIIGPKAKKNIKFTPHASENNIILIWHGTPDTHNNLDNILSALWDIEANNPKTADKINFIIYGQGKARYIMPLVRKSRRFKYTKIRWDAEGKTLHPEADTTTPHATTTLPLPSAIFIGDKDADIDVIINATRQAIPVIDSSDIPKIKDTIYQLINNDTATIQHLQTESHNLYKTQYDPLFHVKQWDEILISLR